MRPISPQKATAMDYQRLWEGVANATDETRAVRALSAIVADSPGRGFVLRLERKDAELCIETLDYGIIEGNLNRRDKATFFLVLRRLAERHALLPERMMIDIEVSGEVLVSGGFGDVRYGMYMGDPVAVKSARVAVEDNLEKIRKRFYKEVILWETLNHQNVLKLVGVQENIEKRQFITVAKWMAHGNIIEYIRKHHTNRLDLLHGAAQGLKYLHGVGLVHGDLKGANVLVSNDTPPRACLADFGFITAALAPGQNLSCSARLDGGTMLFMSPERLVPQENGEGDVLPTPQSDIYSFGLLIFQVLTGELPFPGARALGQIYSVVHNGRRPERPEDAPAIGFSDSLWNLTQRCWDGRVELRPRIGEVVAHLEEAATRWDRLMPPHEVPPEETPPVSETTSDPINYYALFSPPSGIIQGSFVESQTPSELLTYPDTSTQHTEPPQRESSEVMNGLFGRLGFGSRAPEKRDDTRATETSPRINTGPALPPSQIPQAKPKGSKFSKLRRLLGLGQ